MKKKISKTYCFDIDGVICTTYKSYYHKSNPNIKAIIKINNLYNSGNKIILFTSRFMGRSNENKKLAKKLGYRLTLKQLKIWRVKFHKLIFGKPSYDYIIDDKSIFYKKSWHKYI